MEHTNLTNLKVALKKYRDKYGKGDIDLSKFETILVRVNKTKRRK